MSVYQTILVGYDGGDASGVALRQGAALAEACKAQLHVLAIVVTSGGQLLDPGTLSANLVKTKRQILSEAMTAAICDLGEIGRSALICIRDGVAAAEIVAYTHEIRADLVVLGHSEKSLFASWFEGSTGKHLLSHVPCSTLIAIDETLKSDNRQDSERITTISSGLLPCVGSAVVLQLREEEKPNGVEHFDVAAQLHQPERIQTDHDARSWWGLKEVNSEVRTSKNEHEKQSSIKAGYPVRSPTDIRKMDDVPRHHETRK